MGNATVVGSLLAKLGIDTAEFDAGLDESGRKSKAFAKETDANMKGLASRISASASSIRASLVAMSGPIAIAIGAATAAAQAATAALVELNTTAQRSGVAVEKFQELKYAADQSQVGIDALADGLKELQLRADEFVQTGGGSAAESFQRLGYTAEELREKLSDPAALFEEIIDKLGRLDRAAQIRISDELFGGTGGEQFVQFLDQGVGYIGRMRKEARDTGNVIDKEMIVRAAELNREFQKIANTIDTGVKRAVVSTAALMRDFATSFSLVVRAASGDAVAAAQRIAQLQGQIQKAAAQFGAGSPTFNAVTGAMQKELAGLQGKYGAGGGGIGSDATAPLVTDDFAPPAGGAGGKSGGAGGSVQNDVAQRQQALEQRLESLRQTLLTEEELERESYAKRLADLQEGLNTQALTVEQYQELQRKTFEEHNDQLAEIAQREAEREMRIREQLVGNFSDIMGSLASLAETFGEKGFAAAKAFGVAQAGINVAEGITKAMTLPFPLNWAQAAAVAAAGAAQIASIASARPGSAKRPSVSGSAASGSGSQSGGETTADPSRAMYLNIVGNDNSTFSRQQVIALVEQINELRGDGYQIVVAGT